MKKILAIMILMTALATGASAQDYRYEVGAMLGTSGYLGDVNGSNVMRNPGISGGFLFRYLIDHRWSLKANLYTAGISGNSADEKNQFPDGATYKFKSQLYGAGAQMEFNFFNFGVGETYKKLSRISPYLTLGLGLTVAGGDGGNSVAVNLPMGVGVKYKLKERVNLGLEFTMHKVLGDKIDGLSDLYGVKSSFGKNTDWYSMITFSVTYEFSKRCRVCHYVE
ncbi:MAG: porin family protein [Muribaculaceae bacterium]|jgi:opacity protein-like surface antigen|nr:porin family protein [Muribaculaceae bacterium]